MAKETKAQAVNKQKELELAEKEEVNEKKSAARRRLLRGMMCGSVLFFFAEAAGDAGLMLWPRKVTGFDAKITAGKVSDFPPGSVTAVRDGQFFISHVTEQDPETGENYGANGL